jgi:hypothetical protein
LLDRLLLSREVGEFREPVEEDQLAGADRAVSVLGDDQVGEAVGLVVGIAVVVLAKEERDQIRVLLKLPGLAKIGELRLWWMALLRRSGELGNRHHRHLQLAGEDL